MAPPADWPTIGQLVARGAVAYGAREAAVEGADRLSFAALGQRALGLGGGLRASGLGPGERVAYLGENALSCLEAYLGVPAAGLVLLPLNTRLAAAEIRAVLEDSGAQAMLVGTGHETRAAEAADGLGVRLIGTGAALDDVRARGTDRLAHAAAPGDVAYMYYTSGTTGRPKGVMLTHANIMAGALGAAAACGLSARSTWLHAGPMFHLADAFAIWAMTWLGGRQVCLRFAPEAAVRAIEAERVTHTLAVPTVVDLLGEAAECAGTRLEGLQTLFYGGAPMPAPVFARARARLACPLVATYGMTETSGLITCGIPGETAAPDEATGAVNVVGREAPLTELALLDDDGRPVAEGAVGEIVVSGPTVTPGYWNRPEETAAALAEGRLRSGDLGRREPDGAIALVDRKKDMIITGGENVYPREVELVLERHAAVLEAAVVGAPDARWGETVCAFVRLREGAGVTLEEVQAFTRARLAGYKIPRRLAVLDDLPRTGSGKIAKPELRRMAQADRQ